MTPQRGALDDPRAGATGSPGLDGSRPAALGCRGSGSRAAAGTDRWAVDRKLPSRTTRALAIAIMVLGTGAFVTVFDAATGVLQPLVLALWLLAYAAAALALLDARLRTRERAGVPVPLVGLLVLAASSVVWSVSPGVTVQRVVALTGTVLVGVWLARTLTPLQLLNALRVAMLFVAAASLVVYAAGLPQALDEIHGTLRGVVATKNTLGRFLSFGIPAAVAVALLDQRRRRRSIVSAIVMIVALSLTGSTGGSVGSVLALLVVVTAALWGAKQGRMILAAIASLVLGVLCVLVPGLSASSAAGAVGEDATLTGRTEIWRLSLDAFADRPVLGHGYGTFWEVSDAAEVIRGQLQWGVPSAHNGLIDILLDLGLVGGGLAAAALVLLVVRGLANIRAGRPEHAVLQLLVAGVTIISNTAETGLLLQNSTPTLLLVAALAVPTGAARSGSAGGASGR